MCDKGIKRANSIGEQYIKYLAERSERNFKAVCSIQWEVYRLIYEYTGRQRTGKSTLMVADLLLKLLNPEHYSYKAEECYANFWIDVKGINLGDNDQMLEWLLKAKKERWQHKVWLVDECSQPPLFYARNYASKRQTELVTALWQMPKLFNQFLYSSNLGNSVDVQQRDATLMSVMPLRYHASESRDEDYIYYTVMSAQELWMRDFYFYGCKQIQEKFDSFKPIN